MEPQRLLMHADAVKAIVEGRSAGRTPPRRVFRNTPRGRKPWLDQAEASLKRDRSLVIYE
jgi:hypothetical protein